MTKKILFYLWITLFCIPATDAQILKKKVKKNAGALKTSMPPKAAGDVMSYNQLITKDAKSVKGMFGLHLVKDKLYLEIPVKYMDKPMLFAGRVAEISDNRDVVAGQMPGEPLLIKWSRRDGKVYMHKMENGNVAEGFEGVAISMERNNMAPILHAFPVKAYGKDSLSVVVDAGKLFLGNEAPVSPFIPASPFDAIFGVKRLGGVFKPDMSSVMEIKAFPKNISVKVRLAYSDKGTPFTAVMQASIIELPETPMRPRILDKRMGYFFTRKNLYSDNQNAMEKIAYVNRWRVEPRPEDAEAYKKGALVEPAKPIVFYVDDAFPENWRDAIKKGIEDWNTAFEAIGFKNAVVAKDFPKNDPDFDPDDIRYSCIRYAVSSMANAMGPSWTDPRSGEIVQASVYVYHNVMKLIREWRFAQTAQLDERMRKPDMDKEVFGESLRYVVAHEVGHTLGLMHNMRASFSIPVDSLRSPKFTAEYGTTPSIMDYARFNYVAQPEDKGVRLAPPHIGVYDMHMIKLGYKPIEAATPKEEYDILNKWILEKKGNRMYTYGAQQFFNVLDPASQAEALGDDPVKASRYGVKNLRYIMKHLYEWVQVENRDYSDLYGQYKALLSQYTRYIGHCMINMGGMHLYDAVDGDGEKAFVPVSRATQKATLKFLFEEIRTMQDWIIPENIMGKFSPQGSVCANLQAGILRQLMSTMTFGKIGNAARYAVEPYTQQEYAGDLYAEVWKKTAAGKALSEGERYLQYNYVKSLFRELGWLDKAGKGGKSLTEEEENPFESLCEYRCNCGNFGMERNMSSSDKESDMLIRTKTLFFDQAQRLCRLLGKARLAGNSEDKAHYAYLYYELKKMLE